LQFLVDFFEAVVSPSDTNITTKQVIDELFKPFTKKRGGGSVMDAVMPQLYVPQLIAFVSHTIDSQFLLLVESLKKYYKAQAWSEVYLFIDIFLMDLNNIERDLLDRIKGTSENELVVFNGTATPRTKILSLLDEVSCFTLLR
jgi:hypothetical protein